MDGVCLRHLELGFTLGTAQNLAFLDFIFIYIDFCGTFRATDHWSSLRTLLCKVAVRGPPRHLERIIYRGMEIQAHARRANLRLAQMAFSREYPDRPVIG